MKKTLIAAMFALMGLAAASASADTITFDDMGNAPVANGYHGLNWNNFYVTTGSNSGYANGTISAPHVSYNAFANAASFSSATPFTLNDAYFTGAWNDGLSIHVVGTAGSTTFTKDFTVNTSGATDVTFNWTNLTSVNFTSSGGVHHNGLAGSGTHFAMDNLTINAPVPEPETYGMLLVGLGLVGFAARRRKA